MIEQSGGLISELNQRFNQSMMSEEKRNTGKEVTFAWLKSPRSNPFSFAYLLSRYLFIPQVYRTEKDVHKMTQLRSLMNEPIVIPRTARQILGADLMILSEDILGETTLARCIIMTNLLFAI